MVCVFFSSSDRREHGKFTKKVRPMTQSGTVRRSALSPRLRCRSAENRRPSPRPFPSPRPLARRAAGGQKRARVAELFMYVMNGTRTRIAT